MEEIDLTSSNDTTFFTDEEKVVVETINAEFRQEHKLKGEVREFTIFNDIHCYQSVKKKHAGKHKFRVNLSCVNPQPKREFKRADNWLISAAIIFILSLLLIYLGWFSHFNLNKHVMTILAIFSLSFSCILFLYALLKTQDKILFYSQYGQIPVLELMNNRPNKNDFSEFINTLSTHIVKAKHGNQIDQAECLRSELKELRRLKDETVIPESVYEQAKKLILRNNAFTSKDSS